ncbi:hypothetical protein CTAM01_05822 [Colletotrichum tamarilloi]|uniref:Uncharacterized protein n=1 Tax=Colletotrichum tamarilloi TaxID=1209934 RepID=A0ABQ9RDK1_9PEZI|nr:uncharacterized protein CTAM01_05822 [Colletotrichum tamarilloi]KAK1501598.1 hypothetical protein CTAM01_05822 [Colletotrichum tamarilloi]
MPHASTALVRVCGRGSADIASQAAWNPSISLHLVTELCLCSRLFLPVCPSSALLR